jgi:RHS repeat-associated protein
LGGFFVAFPSHNRPEIPDGTLTYTYGSPANNRSYGYQDNVYFLTQGNGPWGLRSWTYDRIGNRLTETRGAVTDSYVYPVNGASGHNPRLQSITLGAGGSRSYGYDEIGDTVQIVDAAQQLDLIHDASRHLTELMTRPEDRSVSFTYDGRSFLSEAGEEEAACFPKRTFALYDSEGLLHRREHRLLDGASSIFLDSDTVLTFAGRPVAVLNLTPSTSKLTYLKTDHLGTPAAATTESGTLLWGGGFEPFGATWNVTDPAVFLRFPGQWSDDGWAGEGVHYNLYRWYSVSSGRYLSPEPLRLLLPKENYLYVSNMPTALTDSDGRQPKPPEGKWCGTDFNSTSLSKPCPDCNLAKTGRRFDETARIGGLKCANRNSQGTISPANAIPIADVDWDSGGKAWVIPQGDDCVDYCLCAHETYHIMQSIGLVPLPTPRTANSLECDAYGEEKKCLAGMMATTMRARLPFR